MTFREYLDQYTCSGIVNGVKKLLIERKISKPYHDTVNSLLLRAHGTQDAAKVVSWSIDFLDWIYAWRVFLMWKP